VVQPTEPAPEDSPVRVEGGDLLSSGELWAARTPYLHKAAEHPRTSPGSVSPFVGRANEISELATALERSRLVTLTGAPGVGKSRLALEFEMKSAEKYRDGVRVVELASISEPALVSGALASAISVHEVPGRSFTDALVAHLRRRDLLLVLDNCEHLVGACAELVEALLHGCPELRILITSREPLAIGGEVLCQVPPLAVPDAADAPVEALIKYDSVRLFVERASAAQPGFSLNAQVAPAIAEIARRLDGIPLALELAAARVEILTPVEIARRLDSRFSLLRHVGASAPPRHQTLQAALDWSHDLLPDPERVLLRRLSVFPGGFDAEAAEAVCAGGQVERDVVVDLISRLVAKSLVVSDNGGSPRSRPRLLETIGAYGAKRLEEAGETTALRVAHARFFLELAELAEPGLTGPHQQEWLDRLEADHANLRSALEWSLSHGPSEWALRMAGSLVLFWRVRCRFTEGRDLLGAAIAASDGAAPGLLAKALWGAGFLALMAGDLEGASPPLEASLGMARAAGDVQGCARALLILGNCRQCRDDSSALRVLEESAKLARRAGDPWCLAHAVGVAGFEHSFRSELSAARELFEECLAVARQAQDPQSLRMGLIGLGSVAVRQGDYAFAESLLEEAASVAAKLGDDYSKATSLQYLGKLDIGRGNYSRARELLEEALRLMPEAGPPQGVLELLPLLAKTALAEGDFTRARGLLERFLTRAALGTSFLGLQGMGELAAREGDVDQACRLFEEALAVARAVPDKGAMAEALHERGELARAGHDFKRAAALHTEALELRRYIGDLPGIAASLEAVAGLSAASSRYDHAARLLGAARAQRDRGGYARAPWESSRHQNDLAVIHDALSAEQFQAAFRQGTKLSADEAAIQASKGRGRRGRPASGWASLTEIEQQVASLAAEGLTNREISERLFVTAGTVKNHLSHIFSKLGIAKRRELEQEVHGQREQGPTGDPRSRNGGSRLTQT